jgi:hypothetical protein
MSRNKFYDKTIFDLKRKFTSETALDILENMQKVYEAKDSDYSATGLPMGNLRKCEDAGIDAWRGCLVRIGDKMSRLENFLNEKDYKVVSEKAEDTIIDLANYTILMSCLVEEVKKPHSDHYWNLAEKAQEDLFKLSYYCVFQAMLIKDNDPESDLSNLEAALKIWNKLCHFSLEML